MVLKTEIEPAIPCGNFCVVSSSFKQFSGQTELKIFQYGIGLQYFDIIAATNLQYVHAISLKVLCSTPKTAATK